MKDKVLAEDLKENFPEELNEETYRDLAKDYGYDDDLDERSVKIPKRKQRPE